MRPLLVRLHRWFGIATASFLIVAGLSGAVIAWYQELDAALNPAFFRSVTPGTPKPPLALADRLEAADPRVAITYLPLHVKVGHTLIVGVAGRTNPATGKPYDLGFNQVALDPVTGAIQGRRAWGASSLSRLNLLPFVYKLHYTLFLPLRGGVDIGRWLMGIVGIAWTIDCIVAIMIAFPSAKTWRKSFAFRMKRGGYALVFDLHRSAGVWLWAVLSIVAVTSVSMNLAGPVVRPIVSRLSPLEPTPLTSRAQRQPVLAHEPVLSREQIVEIAEAAAGREHIPHTPGALLYAPRLAAYGVRYFDASGHRNEAGLGDAWLYWDARTGAPAGRQIPGRGSAGDLFMQAQFPLHSGRIAGRAGRVVVSMTGLAVAMLSVTGLAIWLKKARARRLAAAAARRPATRNRERTPV
jgi:uncharacterized iron-regulated membrane protein